MSAVFMFLSLNKRAGGKLKQTAFFLLDTERVLFDFAKAIEHRREQPDDVVFEWTEPAEVGKRSHPERNYSQHDCLAPDTVLPGLRFLKAASADGGRDTREIWRTLRQRHNGHPAIAARRFASLVARDLEGLIQFCEEAVTRGDVIVPIRVP